MSESKNTKQITWDMPNYGIYTFQPKCAVEKIAIELIQLRLFILDHPRQQKFDTETLKKIMEAKLDQLRDAVLESRTELHEKIPKTGLIQFVPQEIAWASMALSASDQNN